MHFGAAENAYQSDLLSLEVESRVFRGNQNAKTLPNQVDHQGTVIDGYDRGLRTFMECVVSIVRCILKEQGKDRRQNDRRNRWVKSITA